MNSIPLDLNRQVITSCVLHGNHGNTERVVPHLFFNVKYYLIFNQEPCRLWVDGNTSEIQSYCCTLWDNTHEVYYHGLKRPQWRGSWIFAQPEIIDQEIAQCGIQVNHPYHFLYEETVLRYFRNLYEELTTYREPDNEIICFWLHGIFLEMRRIQNNGTESALSISPSLLKARSFIEANLSDPELSLPQIAAEIHQAPNYLSRNFRTHFGVSPIQFLIQCRLKMALNYLQHTNLTVGEIAYMVGYSDPFHFSKLFRQNIGVSPQQFRNANADPGKLQ